MVTAIERLQAARIPVNVYIIAGAPTETASTLRETLGQLRRHLSLWNWVSVARGIRLYSGSPLAERVKGERPELIRSGLLKPTLLEPEQMSLEEVDEILEEAASLMPNLFVFSGKSGRLSREKGPELVKALGILWRLLLPNQPLWRALILAKTVSGVLRRRALVGT